MNKVNHIILTLVILFLASCGQKKIERSGPIKSNQVFEDSINAFPYSDFLGDALPESQSPQIVRQIIKPQIYPKRVALLLPLDGPLAPAAESIKTGFLLGYYNNQFVQRPTIKIFNSNQDIESLKQQLVYEQIDFVVGPLNKSRVSQFLNSSQDSTPILTLNYSKNEDMSLENHFEYGLLPEDEVEQATELAERKGFQRAVIITKDDPWGRRMAEAYRQAWLTEEFEQHEIIDTLSIENPSFASQNVAKILGVAGSHERAKSLKAVTGHTFSLIPRVRQDIDVIFLALQPQLARQIIPLIAFHYGQDIPIIATSHIYPTSLDKEDLADLNNAMFCDIPWILSPKAELLVNAPELFKKETNNRLFAFGYDAFNMIPYIVRRTKGETFRFYGETGMLTLSDTNKIKRRLPFAKIHKSSLKLL